ncbi:LON peptidase substrate-binding domain-containing protein [Aliiruegeria sabulilitoris]|uniref:LON peptidase substrate-binding domain-containing protein n=1 Tax=Aliiruegeria sabulilitoris TaxID=1510458 RepID=UPI0008357A7A|nr:LON peptidase substrate-binding domain-containing protein [Aliiruegeria sabulilitoris]NDR58585.1 ATP-dependent protease [Pseudoruegeria sp. M32A2M]
MITQTDLPDRIPVFPLPGALLLPRARLPLHIFEPRYLAMLDDTLKTSHRLIGMIQPQEGEGGGLAAIGCAGRVTGFSETEDGRYMITLTGISRFRLRSQIEGFTPYIRADVEWNGFDRDLGSQEKDTNFRREAFMELLARFLEMRGLSTDWENLREADDELLINSLGMLLPFDVGDKQALLEAPSLVDRRETLTALMEIALHSGEEGSEVMQ